MRDGSVSCSTSSEMRSKVVLLWRDGGTEGHRGTAYAVHRRICATRKLGFRVAPDLRDPAGVLQGAGQRHCVSDQLEREAVRLDGPEITSVPSAGTDARGRESGRATALTKWAAFCNRSSRRGRPAVRPQTLTRRLTPRLTSGDSPTLRIPRERGEGNHYEACVRRGLTSKMLQNSPSSSGVPIETRTKRVARTPEKAPQRMPVLLEPDRRPPPPAPTGVQQTNSSCGMIGFRSIVLLASDSRPHAVVATFPSQ